MSRVQCLQRVSGMRVDTCVKGIIQELFRDRQLLQSTAAAAAAAAVYCCNLLLLVRKSTEEIIIDILHSFFAGM